MYTKRRWGLGFCPSFKGRFLSRRAKPERALHDPQLCFASVVWRGAGVAYDKVCGAGSASAVAELVARNRREAGVSVLRQGRGHRHWRRRVDYATSQQRSSTVNDFGLSRAILRFRAARVSWSHVRCVALRVLGGAGVGVEVG
jgi:hypothetical protein